MYTQCPQCATWYAITPAELRKAKGEVRCSRCRAQFDALKSLSELKPGAVRAPDAQTAPGAAVAVDAPLEWQTDSEKPPRHSTLGTVLWSLAIVALLVTFIGQYAYFERAQLGSNVRFRPAMEHLCRFVGCELPVLRDIDKIRIVSRAVASHPFADNALLVDAVIVNEAAFTQPYPKLEFELSDIRGRTLAARRFEPAEYLPGQVEIKRGMTPGQPVRLVLELVDPDERAVNFEFSFH